MHSSSVGKLLTLYLLAHTEAGKFVLTERCKQGFDATRQKRAEKISKGKKGKKGNNAPKTSNVKDVTDPTPPENTDRREVETELGPDGEDGVVAVSGDAQEDSSGGDEAYTTPIPS